MNNEHEQGNRVHAVKKVSLSRSKTDSGADMLLIVAEGEVASAGWTNPELVPYTYVQPPPDGIWEFSFYAEPPEGTSRPVVTPIEATYVMKEVPGGLKGVRVFAETNSVETLLI